MSFIYLAIRSPNVVRKSFPVRSFRQRDLVRSAEVSVPPPRPSPPSHQPWSRLIRALFCSGGGERATPAAQKTYHCFSQRRVSLPAFQPKLKNRTGCCVVIVVTVLIGWERSPTKGKNTDARRLKHGRVGGETWCGVQCADPQTVLWIQSLIDEETPWRHTTPPS